MSNLYPFPTGGRPKRSLRRAPVKIGRKTLPFARSVLRIGRWELLRAPNRWILRRRAAARRTRSEKTS